jgi:hypothetical protein
MLPLVPIFFLPLQVKEALVETSGFQIGARIRHL